MKILLDPYLESNPELESWSKQAAAAGRTLNPLNDVVFRSLFSRDDPDSRIALRHLLTASLRQEIKDVAILNPEMPPDLLESKEFNLDVLCSFNDGMKADIEMQVSPKNDYFRKRSSAYIFRMAGVQAEKGKAYTEIKQVYQISFLNFNLVKESNKLPRRYRTLEETEYDLLNDLNTQIFYELPKVRSLMKKRRLNETEDLPAELKWCIFLIYKNDPEKAGIIESLCRQEEGIMHAETALENMSTDWKEWA
jgi:predicted transposase/invertase (TIGR01784 family)